MLNRLSFSFKGARENAIPFYRLEDAYSLRKKMKLLESQKKGYIRVSVIGAGYSGIEVATTVAQTIGKY